MKELKVFDPAMCCSSGVCGPSIDPVLPRFAADLAWLREQGVAVTRYNLAQQVAAFAQHDLVRRALEASGPACLPVILADGCLVSQARYPSRGELAGWAGVSGGGAAGATASACCGDAKERP